MSNTARKLELQAEEMADPLDFDWSCLSVEASRSLFQAEKKEMRRNKQVKIALAPRQYSDN